jgi:hypothetical protein
MLSGGHVIISRDVATTSTSLRLPLVLAFAAALSARLPGSSFFRQGTLLSHYDAKGPSRRRQVASFDNLTPGWQQFGAVVAPLPHLIDVVPAQVDGSSRTGASSHRLVSIGCLAVSTYAAARD